VNSLGNKITSFIDLPLGVTEVVLTQVVGGSHVTVGVVTTTLLSFLGALVENIAKKNRNCFPIVVILTILICSC
jgi:hypothetical protein